MFRYRCIIIVILVLMVAVTTAFASGTGGGKIDFGYRYIDEDGNRSVNQETYNTYEGFGVSLEDWSFLFDNGISIRANLTNITLNNRNLSASIDKPGLFSFNIRNNQYRRIYSSTGNHFTRRRTTESNFRVQPDKHVTFFGGYGITEKRGDNLYALVSPFDTVLYTTDYLQTNSNLGIQVRSKYGYLKTEYRYYSLDDRMNGDRDRQANNISINGSIRLPDYDWLLLSGGYYYRQDKIDAQSVKLTTNRLWAGSKVYLTRTLVFNYQFIFARTEHIGTGVETDNWQNTFTLGHTWKNIGGLRIGYENRISDDLTNRTVSSGLLVSGWYNYKQRFSAKMRVSTRGRDVKSGTVLTGNESNTRHRIVLTYYQPEWGNLSFTWKNQIRENEDISSRVDYNVASVQLTIKRSKYGRATVLYSYYVGEYENHSNQTGYEFSDNTVTGMLYPSEWKNLEVGFGGTYYRSRRDQDIEKFSLKFSALYSFSDLYHIQATYDIYNFDNYLTLGNYYTSNILTIHFIRDFKL